MYFFPEYTDHSYKHIQYVLNTADKLIPENTMKLLSPCDIFVLCLSILFHDLGMHINFHSLITLYNQNIKDKLIGTDMKILWENFVKENCKENTELFDISEILQDKFTKYQNKVANFVREQHPFIAQVIADFGFPDKTGFIEYKEKGKPFYYELSGYIARSHGLDLRNIIEFFKKIYGDLWKTPYGCFAIYLMCIVRIADYLHITDDRINKYKLNLLNFNSKISKDEYLKHKSVYHSQTIYDNPETIYVEVNVDNCNIYLGMLALLESIQRELDSSWAILGEVYGKSDLEMSIRRITSNILSESWQSKSKFVPEKLAFHYDSNLMDLLIEPLYGDNASYAVRELIQNATDACKTRRALEGDTYKPIVEIDIKDGCFIITDNGIGMTLKVIKNHFLNIGSSFRTSEEYKEVVDSSNDSIQRNGKFGIGILTSFLLGNTITVSTKSKEEGIEYVFSTKKDTKVIEIEKKTNNNSIYVGDSPYGTKITIKLYSGVDSQNLIIRDWYKINDININVLNQSTDKRDENLIEEDKLKCENGIWNELLSAKDYGFQKVYWSYEYKINPIIFRGKKDEKSTILSSNLICNGILIPDSYSKRIESRFIENWPTVLIFDADGKLDLNLSRDEINGKLPFIKELENELMKEFADTFINLADEQKNKEQLAFDGHILRYSKLKMQNYLPQKIVYNKKGYSLYNKYFMRKIELKKVVRIWTYQKKEISLVDIVQDDVGYILEGEGRHPNLKNEITGYRNDNFDNFDNFGNIFLDETIFLHRTDFEDYKNYTANLYRLSRKFIDEANIKYLEETKKDAFGLNINFEDISLIIEYKGMNNNSHSLSESDNILSYFGGRANFSYKKDVSE